MKIILEIKFGNEYACKPIEVPCVPAIGSGFWVKDLDGPLEVIEVEFWEGHPEICTVCVEHLSVTALGAGMLAERLEQSGWKLDHGASLLGGNEPTTPKSGMTVLCPNGHEFTYRPYDPLSGRIYCTQGKCWSEGCQGDSGSGTHYDFDMVTAKK